MRPLSPEQHSNVISMLQNGASVRKIASKLGVGKSTVQEIQSGMDFSLKENHGGRPSKLSPQDRRHIV